MWIFKNTITWMVIIVAVAGFLMCRFFRSQPTYVSIREVANQITDEEIKKILVSGDELEIIYVDENQPVVASRKEPGVGIFETLREMGLSSEQINAVEIDFERSGQWQPWLTILAPSLPIVLIGVLIIFMLRAAQQSGNQAMEFTKSRAQLFTRDKPSITFDDVGGLAEAKQALQQIIRFLKEPKQYASLGAQIPKGILLSGPAGSGKTMLARAVAGEAGVPFFYVNASEFIEMFVGVGAARIRDLFDQATKNTPCIMFIDEIDAIGGRRGAAMLNEERVQALNQLLAEMDGFDSDTNVILLGATNRPQTLDPALTRPGRFDRRVTLTLPDETARQKILEIHTRGKPLAPDIDLAKIATGTSDFSGADLAGLVNQAALLAAEANRQFISLADLEEVKSQMVIRVDSVPSPQSIHQYLDQYVISQESAKQVLSVAVSNHYARIDAARRYPERMINIKKSNVLLIGPTGTGKTLLAEAIARYLNVPFAMVNATVLTKTGYIGIDVTQMLYNLLEAADFNTRRAEYGIICIDEIDKLAYHDQSGNSNVGVQQDLLKIIEGSIVDVPGGGMQFAGNVEYFQVNTENILFICEGAFVNLEEFIQHRLGLRHSINRTNNLLKYIQPDDIIAYGFIPELVGRLPITTFTESLSITELTKVLTEPKDSLVNQYTALLALQGWQAQFTPEAVEYVASEAIHRAIGARGLRSIMETVLLDSMYFQDGNGAELLIDEQFVAARLSQEIIDRASPVGSLSPSIPDALASSPQEDKKKSLPSERNLSQNRPEAPCQKCGATERAVLSSGTYCANCGRQIDD